tara:strand:- start:414 stop:629 length:216 start_codon:yes stop_codon:yes gene_type:complete
MVSKHRHGIMVSSMRGVVVGINNTHYDSPKMMVELENGDKVIQDIRECPDSIVTFKPDFRVVSSVGRASDF